MKKIDIRPAIYSLSTDESNGQYKLDFILKAGQEIVGNITDGKQQISISTLRADHFLGYLTPDVEWTIVREKLLDSKLEELL